MTYETLHSIMRARVITPSAIVVSLLRCYNDGGDYRLTRTHGTLPNIDWYHERTRASTATRVTSQLRRETTDGDASVYEPQRLIAALDAGMAPPHSRTLTKRNLNLDEPVIAAIAAVVFALNIVLLLTWCVLRRPQTKRPRRKLSALRTPWPLEVSKYDKDRICAINAQPLFPISLQSGLRLASIDLRRTPRRKIFAGAENQTTEPLTAFDPRSLETEPASIYSAASAPHNYHDYYFYRQSFRLESTAPSSDRRVPITFPSYPLSLTPTMPSLRPSSLAASQDHPSTGNLTLLLSHVEGARHLSSISLSGQSLSDPAQAGSQPPSFPTSSPLTNTLNMPNLPMCQFSFQVTAPLNIRPRGEKNRPHFASGPFVPSHTVAAEQPRRPHDRLIRPPSHVVWKTSQKIESDI
ncbi:unnamed protein product [Somion occarium]|uniref:Uncharacterized protein n=1 Tax=Somion occarium TaxID=3059160 RepID=A0ABP1DKN3_9APHY